MTVFCGSLSVRQDSRRVRFELAKAEAYGGPAGCYQVRINRVWHDVDGKTAFLAPKQAVGMAVMMTLGVFEPEPPPDIPRGIRVSYQTASADGDMPERRETGGTMTEPIRAQDGLVYVGVSVYGRGVVMLPVNSLPITRSVPDTRVHSLAGATKSRPSPSPRCSPGRASTTCLPTSSTSTACAASFPCSGGRRHGRGCVAMSA